MEEWEADDDSDQTRRLLVSWTLSTLETGELALGLRFVSEGDGAVGETGVQILVPAAAALYLAEEIERQARRALS